MGRVGSRLVIVTTVTGALALVIACSSRREPFEDAPRADAAPPATEDGSVIVDDRDDAGLPVGETVDPASCEEAKTSRSYVGCDYWPTVTPNLVWSIFDFAVVVANPGTQEANVRVTGPASVDRTVTVAPGALQKIYLPWVPELKGPDTTCGGATSLAGSVIGSESAYHLVSTRPVVVYQFNAIQYKGEGEGGTETDGGAKDWSTCPASACGPLLQCFSYSNDASLLLPSTALTNNYRVGAMRGTSGSFTLGGGNRAVLTVTATQDDTKVIATLTSAASIVRSADDKVPATEGGRKATIVLAKAGDVLELVSDDGKDFSGSLVQSDKPVQVIASHPCINIPQNRESCDHIEETVPPAETLGKRYVVTPPTGPKGTPVPHVVRFYGNKDGTTLTYRPNKPAGCPDSLNAGQIADCDRVDQAFVVVASNELGVATFLMGGTVYQGSVSDPDSMGDPSQTTLTAVEQFRTKYVFLAPNEYPVLWADIVATRDAEIEVDGKRIAELWEKIGEGPFGVHRVDLTKTGNGGAHTLTAKRPVGVQVVGFGNFTSFQYPAGLNLNLLAAPPPLAE